VSRAGALDRAEIIAKTRQRFAADRMIDAYEAVYRRLITPAFVERQAVVVGETETDRLDREVERASTSSARDLVAAATR
jgi:hypothetical protein